MVHTIVWRVASPEAIDFWAERLAGEEVETERDGGRLRFADPEGLRHELVVDESGDDPLMAEHPEISAEYALRGFDTVRAYSARPDASRALLEEVLGFERGRRRLRGARRSARRPLRLRRSAEPAGVQSAGTVHHVAWASTMEDHEAWRSG